MNIKNFPPKILPWNAPTLYSGQWHKYNAFSSFICFSALPEKMKEKENALYLLVQAGSSCNCGFHAVILLPIQNGVSVTSMWLWRINRYLEQGDRRCYAGASSEWSSSA